MTVQVSTAGPGVESWRSSKFSAVVDGVTAYVYGRTLVTGGRCDVWENGQTIQESWLDFGADQATEVTISLAGDQITSAKVYPGNVEVDQRIVAGDLTLTVPQNVRLHIEVNGDRAEVLSLFSSPLKPALPETNVSWPTRIKTVSAVKTDATGHLTVTGHGYSGFTRVLVRSTIKLPAASQGRLDPHEAVVAVAIDADTLALSDGITAITYADVGDGTITIVEASYDDAANTLHFPSGEHFISRGMTLADDVTLYLDEGAVVTGSFDLRNLNGVTIQGPGILSGEFTTTSELSSLTDFAKLRESVMFRGTEADIYASNKVEGITVALQPWHLSYYGVYSYQNVKLISPWEYTTDGFSMGPKSEAEPVREVVDCYAFVADDAVHFGWFDGPATTTISGTFTVTAGNSNFHGLYNPLSDDKTLTTTIEECDAINLCQADTGGFTVYPTFSSRCIFKCLIDGWAEDTAKGFFNVSILGLRVWGPVKSRLFVLGNVRYPFDFPASAQRTQHGQLNNWRISGLSSEQVPGQISHIVGKDASNTPHTLSFTNWTVAGNAVNQSNYTEHVAVSEFAYAIVFDAVSGTVDQGEIDTTTLAGSYATTAFGDSYLANYGYPTTWFSASAATKGEALRTATAYLDDVYGASWRGDIATPDQELYWPRTGAIDGDRDIVYHDDEIPLRLQRATVELALRHLSGTSLRPDLAVGSGAAVSQSISMGGLSISDSFQGSAYQAPRFPEVESKLRGLLASSPNSIMVRISR